jgi:hypothetical protein
LFIAFYFLILQGGAGIKNSIDILAPMFEENSSETPQAGEQLTSVAR